MQYVTAIVAVCAVIAFFELRRLKRSGTARERWIFSLLMLVGAAFFIALMLHVPMPSPLQAILVLFGPLSAWLDNMMSV